MLFKALFGLIFAGLLCSGCNNADTKIAATDTAAAGRNSVAAGKDSTSPEAFAYESCYQNFFQRLPVFKDSGITSLTLQNGRKLSMTQFFEDEFMSQSSRYGEKDLDGDGQTELIIYNNTGGAHCCDEYFIFSKKAEHDYAFKAHLTSGSACIDASTHAINFSFSEMLGYFFGCYACGFEDSSGQFRIMRDITLQYRRGVLEIVPYNAADAQQNMANLEVLRKHGYEKLEDQMDSGWRKEFAMNLAVWHYNHGKDWAGTKKLFDAYYRFADAQTVWAEFYNILSDAGKSNTF